MTLIGEIAKIAGIQNWKLGCSWDESA
jgi:hypothetical protein